MISIRNLSKHFINETTINYTDIDFEDGKSYMLLGASGCGKSTLLNMIAGILSPDFGQIFIGNEEMTVKTQKEKDKFRIEKIGYIFQDFSFLFSSCSGILEFHLLDTFEQIITVFCLDSSHLALCRKENSLKLRATQYRSLL